MTEDELRLLIGRPEGPALDFKLAYWDNNAALVHDILCMSNSLASGKRYLIVGVEDMNRRIEGTAGDTNRKNTQQITDTLRGAGINHIPNIEVETIIIDNKEVDVVIVTSPIGAPFFLTRDKDERGKRVRAGVIYTRDNDCNTEIDKSASEQVIETLWARRLGADKPPITKAAEYLQNFSNWREVIPGTFHYAPAPEFTLVSRRAYPAPDNFSHPWTKDFPSTSAFKFYVDVLYFTTIIKHELFVAVDSDNYIVPHPRELSTAQSAVHGGAKYFYDPRRAYFTIWQLLAWKHSKGVWENYRRQIEDFTRISGIIFCQDDAPDPE